MSCQYGKTTSIRTCTRFCVNNTDIKTLGGFILVETTLSWIANHVPQAKLHTMGRVVWVRKWSFSGPQILYLRRDLPNRSVVLYTPCLLRKLCIDKRTRQTQTHRQDNKWLRVVKWVVLLWLLCTPDGRLGRIWYGSRTVQREMRPQGAMPATDTR
jgi:hypothetical protein